MKRTWILTLALLLLLSGCAQADQHPETTAPVEEPDPNALDTCFQVTLEAVDSPDPNLVYLESTDCYYVVWHMAWPGGLEVLEGTYLSRGEGGQVLRFTYRDIWEGEDVCYEAVVSTESGLHVLSNRIVEE